MLFDYPEDIVKNTIRLAMQKDECALCCLIFDTACSTIECPFPFGIEGIGMTKICK